MDVDAIVHDLRVFSDPETKFEQGGSGDRLQIKLVRDGQNREYTITPSTGHIACGHGRRRAFASIASLLASDEFADLRTFRATQRRILQAKGIHTTVYIEPEGNLDSGNATAQLKLESFRSAAKYTPSPNLSILLLDGPAGVGKTSLIERIVFERTEPGSAEPPLLHVASSGNRLTDLTNALARATQLLRASVIFDEVPVLVRHGVLQIAIDGFDELVDPDGYKDAWSALREFLAQVGSGGPIILAGRDTFFDQQSFETRIQERIPGLQLTFARLHPVSPEAAKKYLRQNRWSDKDIAAAVASEWLKPGSYRMRPFFLAQIAAEGGWLALHDAHGSPQAFLVNRFVQREAEKITAMIGMDREVAERALWDFYGLIVEDMASQEVDAVDAGFLSLACESAFSSFVSSEDLAKLAHKASSFGLLEMAGRQEHRQFPHSEIQNQFLARAIVANLETSVAVGVFLRRGTIGMALAEAFCDVFSSLTRESTNLVVDRLKKLGGTELFADRLGSNVLTLLFATLTRADLDQPLTLKSMSTNEARVFGTLGAATLHDIAVARLDARSADCRGVTFENCSVGVLTVDETTIFGGTRPDVRTSLQIDGGGPLTTMRSPQEIDRWLDGHSVKPDDAAARDLELPFTKYFDRLCRKFIRQHQIRENDSDEAYFLIQHPFWDEARNVLGARLVVETRTTGGPRHAFYRMVQPENLLNPPSDDRDARQLRDKVIRRARELDA